MLSNYKIILTMEYLYLIIYYKFIISLQPSKIF